MQDTQRADAWSGLTELEPMIRGWLVRRCRNSAELDDAVQDTMLRAARFRMRGHDPRRLEAWVLRIAANTLHDSLRRAGRERVHCQDGVLLDELASPDSVCECVGDLDMERWTLGPYAVTRGAALGALEGALAALRGDEQRLLSAHYGVLEECAGSASRSFPASGAGERGARGAVAGAGPAPRPRIPPASKMRLFRARRRLSRELERRLSSELERRFVDGGVGGPALSAAGAGG